MQKKQMPPFTSDHVLHEDGRFEFRCVHDFKARPWLNLHPHNPLFLQAVNFWAPFETGMARGAYGPEKWTALTKTEWTYGVSNIGIPVRGIAAPVKDDESLSYDIKLHDNNDAMVYHLKGEGVIFQNRDFATWRGKAKAKIAALPKPKNFEYAPVQSTGAATQSQSFVSKLVKGVKAQGFITVENGFIPNHPHLSGSGDHVNATHLHVLGEQFTTMLEGGRTLTSPSGTMTFNRYVELGHPIDILLNEKLDGYIDLSFFQAENLCAGMSFDYELSDY